MTPREVRRTKWLTIASGVLPIAVGLGASALSTCRGWPLGFVGIVVLVTLGVAGLGVGFGRLQSTWTKAMFAAGPLAVFMVVAAFATFYGMAQGQGCAGG